MAKFNLNDITGSFASIEALNSRMDLIEAEFNDKVLYRNNPGSTANEMNNDLDMNGQDILNLPEPVDPTSPVRLIDISDLGALGASQLSELDDVDDALAPLAGQGLVYNAVSGLWETAVIPGFSAISLDDLVDVDLTTTPPIGLDVLTYNNGTGMWEPLAVGGGGGGRVQLTADVSFTVGPTGDFATVKEGLNYLLNTYSGPQAVTTETGHTSLFDILSPVATLTLEAGVVWDEQITLSGVDASWIVVSSTDGVVNVDSSAWTSIFTLATFKPGITLDRAISPVINLNVLNTSTTAGTFWVYGLQSTLYTGTNFDVVGFDSAVALTECLWRAKSVGVAADYSFDCGNASSTAISLFKTDVEISCNLSFESVIHSASKYISAINSKIMCANLDLGANANTGISVELINSRMDCYDWTSSVDQIKRVEISAGSHVHPASIDLVADVAFSGDFFNLLTGSSITTSTFLTIDITALGGSYALNMAQSKISSEGTVNVSGITGDTRMYGGEIDCTAMASDLLLSGKGSIVKIEGTWAGSSATPKNTLTAAGIIFN